VQGKTVVRVQVPRGDDPPYAIDDNKIYVRDEAETSLAVRDEIVRLVQKSPRVSVPRTEPARVGSVSTEPQIVDAEIVSEPLETIDVAAGPMPEASAESAGVAPEIIISAPEQPEAPKRSRRGRRGGQAQQAQAPQRDASLSDAPRTGVEIIGTETRKGEQFHIMRDLRNGSIVKNVTRSSARRLWHYAIIERETNPVDASQVQWVGNIGLWKRYKRGGVIRYDLVQRENGNSLRVFYGVTDDGMHGPWQQFVSDDAADLVEVEEDETRANE
jgi:hypothetical protein